MNSKLKNNNETIQSNENSNKNQNLERINALAQKLNSLQVELFVIFFHLDEYGCGKEQ